MGAPFKLILMVSGVGAVYLGLLLLADTALRLSIGNKRADKVDRSGLVDSLIAVDKAAKAFWPVVVFLIGFGLVSAALQLL